jgi:dipeptidase E
MRNLLLVSTSTTYGTAYLEHCTPQSRQLFRKAKVGKILFVPFALADRDSYAQKARAAFSALGLELDSIHRSVDPIAAIHEAAGLFVGGGKLFVAGNSPLECAPGSSLSEVLWPRRSDDSYPLRDEVQGR